MNLTITKEELIRGINIVDRATSTKPLQPVLLNILVETLDKNTVKLAATDLDLAITTIVDTQVKKERKITIPSKKLKEIATKIPDGSLIELDINETIITIKAGSSKFEIIGIDASEFPTDTTPTSDGIEMEVKPFVNAIKRAGFAAATFESSNLLSGIVFAIVDNVLEIASTDGNRLARYRQKIDSVKEDYNLIIPAKALNEFEKISSLLDEKFVHILKEGSKVIIKSAKTTLVSRLLEGMFPKYNQLIPSSSPKKAVANIKSLTSALERVAVMVNEKTNIVNMDFSADKLMLNANTPDAGKSEESLSIKYDGDDLLISFNYKYVIDALKNIDAQDVEIGLNTSLSATIFKPSGEDDMICLIMPMQNRG
jgi:DNA polymerase-3 subunit beta